MNTFKDRQEDFSFLKKEKDVDSNSIILTTGDIVSRNKIVKTIKYLKETTALTNKSIAEKLKLENEVFVTEVLRDLDQSVYEDINSQSYSEMIGRLYQRLNLLTSHAYKLLSKAPKTNYPVYMQAIKLAGERVAEEIKFLEKTKILKEKQNPLDDVLVQAERMNVTELKTKLEKTKERINSLNLDNFEMLELEREIQYSLDKKGSSEDDIDFSDKLFENDS